MQDLYTVKLQNLAKRNLEDLMNGEIYSVYEWKHSILLRYY